jgi:hypothetical protein
MFEQFRAGSVLRQSLLPFAKNFPTGSMPGLSISRTTPLGSVPSSAGLSVASNHHQLSKFRRQRNPFDCVAPHRVGCDRWAFRIVAMLETVTALFGVMSAGIFIAHAIDGYRYARLGVAQSAPARARQFK